MSDLNRGAYTPQSEAPLAFDARRVGGGGRRPMPITLIVSLIVLLIMVGVFFVLYRNGVRDAGEPPQPVGQPMAEIKGPAPADAAPVEGPEGLQIYADGQPIPPAPEFAPPPEEPIERPTVEDPAIPPPKAQAPPAPKAEAAPKTVEATPAPTPPAPKTPAAQAAVAAAPKTAAVPSTVQLGAFSTRAAADAQWAKVAGMAPGEVAGRTKRIEPTDVEGRTLYRALIGGFDSRTEAQAFCGLIVARGELCTVR